MSTAGPLHNKSRSRRGCWTCRQRKVKCDEERPSCRRCVRLGRLCDYEPRQRKAYTKKQPTHRQPEDEIESTPQGHSHRTNLRSLLVPSPPGLEAPGIQSRHPAQDNQGEEGRSHFLTPRDQVSNHVESPIADGEWLSRACCAILSSSDHAAIRCFRFVFSPTQDTKDPIFSIPAIVWTLAQRNTMVLHMVCAVGGQELAYLHGTTEEESEEGDEEAQPPQSRIAEHYGAALRLLATAIHNIVEMVELDYILGTLWLMVVYEQKYGDGCGSGLTIHLRGAGYLLQGRLQNLGRIIGRSKPCVFDDEGAMSPRNCGPEDCWQISGFSSRMIVWISFLDGGAALNGLGGGFNELLGEAMDGLAEDKVMSLIQGFRTIHRHSHAAFQETWGASYPQTQLLEDLEIRHMFYLYGECGQLRYLLSKVAVADWHDNPNSKAYLKRVACALNDVAMRYGDILEVASSLQLVEGCPRHRYVTNIRFVVPQYNAVLLCFFRISRRRAPLNHRQRGAIRVILDLAHQAYSDAGEEGILKVAWPLFVAALETDEPVHRAWILERYQVLSTQGQNYRRANEALKAAFAEQRMNERRLDFLQLVRRNDLDRFVI